MILERERLRLAAANKMIYDAHILFTAVMRHDIFISRTQTREECIGNSSGSWELEIVRLVGIPHASSDKVQEGFLIASRSNA